MNDKAKLAIRRSGSAGHVAWRKQAIQLPILDSLDPAPEPKLSLSPFEFTAKHVKERIAHPQQADLVLRFAAKNPIPLLRWHPNLTINTQVSLFFNGRDHHGNLRAVVNNQRPMGQCVRRNGSDDECLYRGH